MRQLFKVAQRYSLKLAEDEERFDTEPSPPHPGVAHEIDVPEGDPVPTFEEEEEQPETLRETYDLKLDRQSIEFLLDLVEKGGRVIAESFGADHEGMNDFYDEVNSLTSYIKRTLQK